MKATRLTLSLAIAMGLISSLASANVLLRTGVDAGLNVLTAGTSDPFWTISTNGTTFNAAKVIYPAQVCCGMETAASSAAWITDPSVTDSSDSTGWGISNTVYARRSFNTTGYDVSTLALSGIWRVADYRYGVYLNGNLIDPVTANGDSAWSTDQSLSLAAGSGFFLSGLNTLELRGMSGNSQWDGFYFNATVTGRQSDGDGGDVGGQVPEPSTFALLGLGLLGLVSRKRFSRG